MMSMAFIDHIIMFAMAVVLCRLLLDVDNAVRRDNNVISGVISLVISLGVGLTLAVAVISAIETIKQLGGLW